MVFLAINYHYIDDEKKYERGIYPVSVKRFQEQLEKLGKFFTFVGQKDVLDALAWGKKLPENCCVVTFDDRLKSQYEQALPILNKMGIPAIFFINGLPYLESKALFVHKVHWARSKMSPAEFLGEVSHLYTLLTGEPFNLGSFINMSEEQLRSFYPYDHLDETRIKIFLNKSTLDLALREQIINTIFKSIVKEEKEFCDNFYMTNKQVLELYKNGSIGWHGYAHKPVTLLSDSAMQTELKSASRVLSYITGDSKAAANSVSFPHTIPVSLKIAQVAGSVGMKFGFTMEKAFNTSLLHPLLFSRLDANDIPGGKAPLFSMEDNGIKILDKKLNICRREYFEEGT